jgi:hypothetical protein
MLCKQDLIEAMIGLATQLQHYPNNDAYNNITEVLREIHQYCYLNNIKISEADLWF